MLLSTVYLFRAPIDTLQRDWMMVLPSLLVAQLALSGGSLAYFLGGVAVGAGATIKPQILAMGGLLFLAILTDGSWYRRKCLNLLLVGGGCLLPLLAMVAWLKAVGSWEAFAWSWSHYLGPLYASLDANGRELPTGLALYAAKMQNGLRYLLTQHRTGPLLGVVVAAAVLLWRQPLEAPLRRRFLMLIGVIAYGLLHVFSVGKFWPYHWWPFHGGALLLLSLLLRPMPLQGLPLRAWTAPLLRAAIPLYGVAILSFVLFFRSGQAAFIAQQLDGVDQITSILERETRPGERVQVFDTTGGGIHAAYQARRLPGSRFIYDFHFFHHMQSDAVQLMRQQLLSDLKQQRPAFLVIFAKSWAHRMSYQDLDQFPELVSWMDREYQLYSETSRYRVLVARARNSP
jgi:hypothetical protein